MGTIIEGIDYNLCGVDYKTRYKTLVDDTFDTNVRQEFESLWHFIDFHIDRQAKDNGNLYVDAEDAYRAVEDFCIHKNINIIPPLYRTLFDAKRGFLTQVRFPVIIKHEWIEKFPQPIQARVLVDDKLVQEFRSFLLENEKKYRTVLIDLEDFGYQYDFGSSDDE